MSKTGHSIAAFVAVGWLASCATVYEGKYDWDAGWRSGRVIQLGVGTAVASVTDDCRKDVPLADVTRTRYAEVAYRSEGRWLRQRIVPIPDGMAIKDGEAVYVNMRSCDNGLVKASRGS